VPNGAIDTKAKRHMSSWLFSGAAQAGGGVFSSVPAAGLSVVAELGMFTRRDLLCFSWTSLTKATAPPLPWDAQVCSAPPLTAPFPTTARASTSRHPQGGGLARAYGGLPLARPRARGWRQRERASSRRMGVTARLYRTNTQQRTAEGDA